MRSSAAWWAPASPRPAPALSCGTGWCRQDASRLSAHRLLAFCSRWSWSLRCPGSLYGRHRLLLTARSSIFNSSLRRSTRLAMAAMTRRRRWVSSPCCCIRKVTWATQFYVPFWVVIACQIAMAVGTLIGGWRIVKTMGSKITRLTPMQGFCAETGGSMTLFAATWLGVPVSTTHTITGVDHRRRRRTKVTAVRWVVARQDCHRLDHYDPGDGRHRRAVLLAEHAFRLITPRRVRESLQLPCEVRLRPLQRPARP